jgi:hypothetical protein
MTIDASGVTLANITVPELNLPPPPVNPTPEQAAQYVSTVQAQVDTWTKIWNSLFQYMISQAVVTVTVTVPASGLLDSTGHACTGTAHGTGTGTIS